MTLEEKYNLYNDVRTPMPIELAAVGVTREQLLQTLAILIFLEGRK